LTDKFTVGLLVNNRFGVLNRVTGLFRKRGYNIDSLAVGETENPEYSRITIVCTGSEYMCEQVLRQLDKLVDVIQIVAFDPADTVSAEHLMLKLRVSADAKPVISDLINYYSGKVRDFGADYITAEFIAATDVINEIIEASRRFGILETCRSGAIAMTRGVGNMLIHNSDGSERENL
jgi:acetolactate synthase-1/3 small subunit